MTTVPPRQSSCRTSRMTAAFYKIHGQPVEGVPRWVRLAAYLTSLTVLPSCLWRLAFGALNLPVSERPPLLGSGGDGPAGMPGWLYMILLSVVSEGLAFLTVGLVSQWGEVFPRWVPFVGGRRVPTLAAVVPAGLGAVALMAISVFALFMAEPNENFSRTFAESWQLNLLYACYLPLLAWGPLLAIVTIAYYRRRRRENG
jgi:hypothetical protein